MNYIFLSLIGLMIAAFQTMISNLFFFGKLMVEVSLITAIYAGFNMSLMKGGVFSFILGFFLDCFLGSFSGLFAFSYVIIFLFAKFFSLRVYAERASFIVIFIGLCALIEGMFVMIFYKLAFGVDKFHHLWDVFLPQALLTGLFGPSFFKLFHKVLSDGGITRPVKRSAIG